MLKTWSYYPLCGSWGLQPVLVRVYAQNGAAVTRILEVSIPGEDRHNCSVKHMPREESPVNCRFVLCTCAGNEYLPWYL